jgi:hypothetical protein
MNFYNVERKENRSQGTAWFWCNEKRRVGVVLRAVCDF